MAQNNNISWLIGPIEITLEKHGKKAAGNINSSETNVSAKRVEDQSHRPKHHSVKPPSEKVWNGTRKSDSQPRKDKAGFKGKPKPTN